MMIRNLALAAIPLFTQPPFAPLRPPPGPQQNPAVEAIDVEQLAKRAARNAKTMQHCQDTLSAVRSYLQAAEKMSDYSADGFLESHQIPFRTTHLEGKEGLYAIFLEVITDIHNELEQSGDLAALAPDEVHCQAAAQAYFEAAVQISRDAELFERLVNYKQAQACSLIVKMAASVAHIRAVGIEDSDIIRAINRCRDESLEEFRLDTLLRLAGEYEASFAQYQAAGIDPFRGEADFSRTKFSDLLLLRDRIADNERNTFEDQAATVRRLVKLIKLAESGENIYEALAKIHGDRYYRDADGESKELQKQSEEEFEI